MLTGTNQVETGYKNFRNVVYIKFILEIRQCVQCSWHIVQLSKNIHKQF